MLLNVETSIINTFMYNDLPAIVPATSANNSNVRPILGGFAGKSQFVMRTVRPTWLYIALVWAGGEVVYRLDIDTDVST